MKRFSILCLLLVCIACLPACSVDSGDGSGPVKIHEDIGAETIQGVHISGNASSIVIRQGAGDAFAVYNADLNKEHTYEVHCEEEDGQLDIEITMENPENDNDILGSVLIDIPQKELETVEVTGGFRQVSLDTLRSDVRVHNSGAFVNLDLDAESLDHNITLEGSESNPFQGVSLYFDGFPENASLDLNPIQDGAINDTAGFLEENGLASGSGKPVISIHAAKEINIYKVE